MILNKLKRREKQAGVTERTPGASPGSGCSRAAPDALKDTCAPKSSCTKDVKIAPIFLHAKRGRCSDGRPRRSAEVQGEGLQSQQVSSTTSTTSTTSSSSSSSSSSSETLQSYRRKSQLSSSVVHSCLQEIQTSSPSFAVRAVFSTLQRRAGLQEGASSEAEPSLDVSSLQKRKRTSDSSEAVPKRLRSSGLCAEGSDAAGVGRCPVLSRGVEESRTVQRPRISKLSRTHRLRQQSLSQTGLVNDSEPNVDPDSCSQPLKTCNILHRALSVEDVLWTDKYSPRHSSEVIGKSTAVNKLQSWLRKWKLRADCDERRKLEEVKREEENSRDSWDCGDFQGEAGPAIDREEPLCNTMLITGPAGVGKTASVYACSQELGFKVFEVNCSSLRSGCHVLSQLKEATQSHLVETSGKDQLKPAYFNNYSSASKSEGLLGKTAALKNVTSTSRKRAAQRFGGSGRRGKAKPATVTLAQLFMMKAPADRLHSSGSAPADKPDCTAAGGASPGPDQTAQPDKKTATSLILFEEVDVIFDEDVGFLAAIKAFMATTKRPVVLTTNDPTFRERFCGSMEEIVFKTPSVVSVCSYLRLVALAEDVRLEPHDVAGLVRLCRGDVRRCLLQLQLWIQSGGGSTYKEASLSESLSVDATGDCGALRHRDCDAGCTQSMLGLPPVTQNQLLNLLKVGLWSEKEMMWLLGLLSESWRSGVPLLYSNLELLLPLRPEDSSPDSDPRSGPSPPRLHVQRPDPKVGLKTTSTTNQPVRRVSMLSRKRRRAHPTSSSTVTPNQQRAPCSSNTASSSRDRTERDVLAALTDFFSLMSDLDSTVLQPRSADVFVWTGAEFKDGLSGERGEEEEEEEKGCGRGHERLLDVQAAIEGLGCHRCVRQVLKAWTEAQEHREQLGDVRWRRLVEMLPAPPRGRSLSFSCQSLCAQSVCHRRFSLSRTVLSSDAFSLLGDRRAVCLDYLPVLRHICRWQRAQTEETISANYLRSSNLGLSKATIQLLAEEFPSGKTLEKDCTASHPE